MLAPLPLGLAPTPIDTDARLGDSRSAPWARFRPTRSNFLALDSLPFLDLLLVCHFASVFPFHYLLQFPFLSGTL